MIIHPNDADNMEPINLAKHLLTGKCEIKKLIYCGTCIYYSEDFKAMCTKHKTWMNSQKLYNECEDWA